MKTARIFQEPDGFHWTPTEIPFLDARGPAHATRQEAMRAAYNAGRTHVVIGTSRRKISALVALDDLDHAAHQSSREVCA